MYKYKRILSFCSLLLCSLLFLNFGSVSVKAAEQENLIESDLRDWNNLFPETTSVFYRYRVASGVTYDAYGFTSVGELIEGTDNNIKLKASSLYSLKSLVSGKSYSFSFHLLDFEEANFITSGITSENYYGGLLNGNGQYIIGLCSFNSKLESFDMVEGAYIVINKDNYLDYYGKDNTISFVLPNVVNPCIVITYYESSKRNYQQNIYLNDINLVDNDEAETDSLLERLFAWFEKKFDALGENFEILGIAIGNIPDAIVDGIKSLFIPSDDFMDEWEPKMKDELTEHLGVVFQSADTFTTLFTSVFDLLDGSDSGGNFTFPALNFDLNFGRGDKSQSYDIDLYDGDESVDLSFLNDQGSFWYTFYHSYYKAILYIILSGALLLYAYNVCDRLFR